MTTLYRPVLIESAEQAEALPIGTITLERSHGLDLDPPSPRSRTNRYPGYAWHSDYDGALSSDDMVGFTALVPIEAKEERVKDYFFDRPGWMSRLVTPWEEQS